jgi:MoaA/NifB/PqqE/SkfB family radical SAM enzyme
MAYKFSDNCTVIENLDKVVLANRKNGKWIRITSEVYNILNLGTQNGYSINQLKSYLFDDDDKYYIVELYKKLSSADIIEDENCKHRLNSKIALFEITHRCNLRCIHCCIDAKYMVSSNIDLSTTEIITALDKIIAWKPEHIALTGGEPLIRNDLFVILKHLRKNYTGQVQVLTNGTLINEINAKKLCKYVDQIDISLDGIDEETCSIVRGEGVFTKVLKSIEILHNYRFYNISLSIALGDKNYYLEDDFVKLNEKLGTTPLIRTFEPVGRGDR